MLLGTFHFQDARLDEYKPREDIGILSSERQAEVSGVVSRLAGYRPTKVAVEIRPDRQADLDREYADFLSGRMQLAAGEVHQLAFRLASRQGHERLYCVDAWGRYYEPPVDIERHAAGRTTKELQEFLTREMDFDPQRGVAKRAEALGQSHLISAWATELQRAGEAGEAARLSRSLRETLLRLNDEKGVWRSHAFYLGGWFKIGSGSDYPGVDMATAWYNRNLRIFANLQRITDSPDDRILLIIGAGHLPVLRHCVLASPDHQLVEVADYLE